LEKLKIWQKVSVEMVFCWTEILMELSKKGFRKGICALVALTIAVVSFLEFGGRETYPAKATKGSSLLGYTNLISKYPI